MSKNKELLAKFMKANKTRRQRLAQKAGFSKWEDYKLFLERGVVDVGSTSTYEVYKSLPKNVRESIAKNAGYKTIAGYMSALRSKGDGVETNKKKVKVGTIYNVHILDASGSMTGPKFSNAVRGIENDLETVRNNPEGVNFKNVVVSFSGYRYIDKFEAVSMDENPSLPTRTRGVTALHDAVGKTLTELLVHLREGDKAIVTIFTDGGENDSREWGADGIRGLIKEAEDHGVTVTFMGTEWDVRNTKSLYRLREGNTLVHDNTPQGISKSYLNRSASVSRYTSAAASGQSVSSNFFTKETGEL